MDLNIRSFEKKIIREVVSERAAFPSVYPLKARKWFVTMILLNLRPSETENYDSEPIKQDCLDFRNESKTLVTEVMGEIVTTDPLKKWGHRRRRTIMAQIAYGILGLYPVFIRNQTYRELFRFIVKRRYFTLVYMVCALPEAFEYPEPVLLEFSRVNQAANDKKYWEGITEYSEIVQMRSQNPELLTMAEDNGWANDPNDSYFPFRLSTDGKANPVDAVEELFHQYPDRSSSKRTHCDCATAAACVHLAGLIAAHDKARFFDVLAQVPNYLMVDHVWKPCRLIDGTYKLGERAKLLQPCFTGNNVEVQVENPMSVRPASTSWATWVPTMPETANAFQINQTDVGEAIEISHVQKFTPGDSGEIRIIELDNGYEADSLIETRNVMLDRIQERALFEHVKVYDYQLIAGDQVYLVNHPLYRVFFPMGEWSGEFAFVLDTFKNHDPLGASRLNMRLSGHGYKNSTVKDMISDMLADINKGLVQARRALGMALAWIANIKSGSVTVGFTGFPHDPALEFVEKEFLSAVDGKDLYVGITKEKASADFSTLGGIVIFRIDDWEHPFPVWMVERPQAGAPAQQHNYFVRYEDNEGQEQFFSLYNLPGAPRRRRLWTARKAVFADIKNQLFAGRNNGAGTLTTSPRVNVNEDCLQYLIDSGAIAPTT